MVTTERIGSYAGRLAYYIVHGFILMIISTAFWCIQVIYPNPRVLGIWAFGVPLFVLVTMILGLLNSIIEELMWHINLRRGNDVLLFQGLKILVPTQLLYYAFPVLLIMASSYDAVTRVLLWEVLILIYCIFFGIIGKTIADQYQEIPKRKRIRRYRPSKGTRSVCTRCGASHIYPEKAISQNNTVRCYTCGKEFIISSTEKLLENVEKSNDSIDPT